MNKIKALALENKKIVQLTQFAAIMAIVLIAPMFHQQAITGPIVNAALFGATILFGIQSAILIALIPSLVALSVGLLPAILAPVVPFIMVSNTILILTFDKLKEKNYWLGVVVSSILKFAFLFSTSSLMANLVLKKEVATKIAVMMSWPQLLTALAGGIIAYFIFRAQKEKIK